MKIQYYLCVIIVLWGCSSNEELVIHDDPQMYQGVWRDTIYTDYGEYVEDLIIIDNSIEYSMAYANTHLVLDTLSGTLLLGNDNTIVWNCISPITNTTRQTCWKVLDLTPYHMHLFSDIHGERNYRKVYRIAY